MAPVPAFAAVLAAASLTGPLRTDELPLAQRLRLIHLQRQFIDSLGAAACDLAALHRHGPAVRWVPGYDVSSCNVCLDIIGPPQFIHDLGFDPLVRIAASRSCHGANQAPPTGVTDGSESPAAMAFVRQYLDPANRTNTLP